jgi:hypothetical protein
MSDYDDDPHRRRNGELARERTARREAAQDARDRRASLAATKAQIQRARGDRGEPVEPEYKPEAEWSTTERQIFATRGIKPLVGESDAWGDDD